MKITKQARRDAKSLFQACRVDGVLDEGKVRTVVAQVLAQKPRGYLGVLTHFQRLLKLDLARRAARVESAVALPSGLRSTLEANLSKRYGTGLSIVYSEDSGLIGGLRVQVGSDVYDGSIRARLAALSETF